MKFDISGNSMTVTAVDKAGRLLKMAGLFVRNDRPDLAERKLKALIAAYPKTAAAKQAKEMLAKLKAVESKDK